MKKLLYSMLLLSLLTTCTKEQYMPPDTDTAFAAKSEAEVSYAVVEQVEQLSTFTDNLDILFGPKNSILVQLRNIQNKLERGQNEVALSMLSALLIHIEELGASGTIDADVVAVLLEKVEWIRCDLDPGCGNPLAVVVETPAGAYTLFVTLEDQISGYPVTAGIRWGGYGHNLSLPNPWPVANAVLDFNGGYNTRTIVEELTALGLGATAYAAKVCDELVYLGHDDWYLPALGELKAIYLQLGSTTTLRADNQFLGNFYWSSTESTGYYAWTQYFTNGIQTYTNKNHTIPGCRCARRGADMLE